MNRRLINFIFGAILLAYGLYAGVFIAKTVFVSSDGRQFTALFDDMMISMTYARNLAEGHGLVWYPGAERVEGFSNPLWVVFMAGFHLLPIPENWISLPLQISGGIFFIASLFFLKKIAGQAAPDQPGVMLLAVLLTAFYYPLSNWSLLGLEVSLLLLMVNAGAYLALRTLAGGRYSRGLYLLLGLATLVRVDAAVTYLTLWGLMVLFDRSNRRRHLLEGGVILVLFLGGQTLWRWFYYGQWVPNTYTLKIEGFPLWARARRGWEVFVLFVRGLYWPLFFLPFSVFLFRRDRKVLLLALLFLAQAAYSIYVGGDSWEHRGGSNRFISLGMPAFMLLFSLAVGEWHGLARRLAARWLPRLERLLKPAFGLGVVLLVVFSMLMWNRLVDSYGPVTNLRAPQAGALRYFFQLERSIYMPGSQRYVEDALVIRQVTQPQASVAMVAAGNICYFVQRPCVDLLGKSDAVVARRNIQVALDSDWQTLQPGHVKFDYAYSVGQLQPDVIVEVIGSTTDIAAKYLQNYAVVGLNGHNMYFKEGSAYIDWEKLENAREN